LVIIGNTPFLEGKLPHVSHQGGTLFIPISGTLLHSHWQHQRRDNWIKGFLSRSWSPGIKNILPVTFDGFVKSPDAALRQAQGRLSAVRGEPVEPRAPCLQNFLRSRRLWPVFWLFMSSSPLHFTDAVEAYHNMIPLIFISVMDK